MNHRQQQQQLTPADVGSDSVSRSRGYKYTENDKGDLYSGSCGHRGAILRDFSLKSVYSGSHWVFLWPLFVSKELFRLE